MQMANGEKRRRSLLDYFSFELKKNKNKRRIATSEQTDGIEAIEHFFRNMFPFSFIRFIAKE